VKFHPNLYFVFAVIVLLQVICFGPIMTHVGFYLDDWATLAFLHFAPKEGGYLGLLHYYLFNDSRVLIRPLEVLHFGTIYFLCADKPLLYHLVNLLFEAFSSLFLYCILVRLSGQRAIALAASLCLLLYPSHDSTRYWVICSSVTLSLALYLFSFLASIKATDHYLDGERKPFYLWLSLSFLSFLLSLLNYETFLPMAALTVLTVLVMAWRRQKDWKKAGLAATIIALPLALSVGGLLVFLKVIVPKLGHGYAHAITFDAKVMLATIGQGLSLNTPWQAVPFFYGQAQSALAVLTSSEIVRLVVLLVVAGTALFYLLVGDKKDSPASEPSEISGSQGQLSLQPVDFLLLGLFAIFVSYTIFGLSPDYLPTYITLVNRVNTAASLGVVLVLVAVLQWSASALLKSLPVAGNPLFKGLFLTAACAVLLLFTLADWGLAKPWIVSWTTQKEVRGAVSQLTDKLDDKASLLLISCPRYVMWSPVFDGVWDFQNMVRITLNRPLFNANVVSERLSLSPTGLKDVSYGYECGSYPFDDLYLMVAPHPQLLAVKSAAQFVDLVEQRGMTFGFDKKTLSKWKEVARLQSKLEPSH